MDYDGYYGEDIELLIGVASHCIVHKHTYVRVMNFTARIWRKIHCRVNSWTYVFEYSCALLCFVLHKPENSILVGSSNGVRMVSRDHNNKNITEYAARRGKENKRLFHLHTKIYST